MPRAFEEFAQIAQALHSRPQHLSQIGPEFIKFQSRNQAAHLLLLFVFDADLNVNLIVYHLNWIRPDGLPDRGRHRLSGRDVKPSAVQGAFDGIAFDESFGKISSGVCASVIGGVERPSDIVERKLPVADLNAPRRSFGNLAGVTDTM